MSPSNSLYTVRCSTAMGLAMLCLGGFVSSLSTFSSALASPSTVPTALLVQPLQLQPQAMQHLPSWAWAVPATLNANPVLALPPVESLQHFCLKLHGIPAQQETELLSALGVSEEEAVFTLKKPVINELLATPWNTTLKQKNNPNVKSVRLQSPFMQWPNPIGLHATLPTVPEGATTLKALQALRQWVHQHVTLSAYASGLQPVAATLQQGYGNPSQRNWVLFSLLQQLKAPVRLAVGLQYVNESAVNPVAGWQFYSWPEVLVTSPFKLNGQSLWLPVDMNPNEALNKPLTPTNEEGKTNDSINALLKEGVLKEGVLGNASFLRLAVLSGEVPEFIAALGQQLTPYLGVTVEVVEAVGSQFSYVQPTLARQKQLRKQVEGSLASGVNETETEPQPLNLSQASKPAWGVAHVSVSKEVPGQLAGTLSNAIQQGLSAFEQGKQQEGLALWNSALSNASTAETLYGVAKHFTALQAWPLAAKAYTALANLPTSTNTLPSPYQALASQTLQETLPERLSNEEEQAKAEALWWQGATAVMAKQAFPVQVQAGLEALAQTWWPAALLQSQQAAIMGALKGQSALNLAKQAAERFPLCPPIQWQLATLQEQAKQLPQALATYQQVLRLASSGNATLSSFKLEAEQKVNLLSALVATEAGKSPQAFLNLATILQQQGQPTLALKAAYQGLQVSPPHSVLKQRLQARCLLLETALALAPNAEASVNALQAAPPTTLEGLSQAALLRYYSRAHRLKEAKNALQALLNAPVGALPYEAQQVLLEGLDALGEKAKSQSSLQAASASLNAKPVWGSAETEQAAFLLDWAMTHDPLTSSTALMALGERLLKQAPGNPVGYWWLGHLALTNTTNTTTSQGLPKEDMAKGWAAWQTAMALQSPLQAANPQRLNQQGLGYSLGYPTQQRAQEGATAALSSQHQAALRQCLLQISKLERDLNWFKHQEPEQLNTASLLLEGRLRQRYKESSDWLNGVPKELKPLQQLFPAYTYLQLALLKAKTEHTLTPELEALEQQLNQASWQQLKQALKGNELLQRQLELETGVNLGQLQQLPSLSTIKEPATTESKQTNDTPKIPLGKKR